MTNLLLIKFNNYYNRMAKKLDTTADYTAASSGYLMYKSVNFDKKNGVMTTVTLNDSGLSNGPYASTIAQEDADYLVEFDDQANILSRWFIIETTMTRLGQHRFDLRRDVIVDNYDSVLDAVTYVEKATVTAGDVAIYNHEDIEFNQIKTNEWKLSDRSKQAWIIGYYDALSADTTVNIANTGVNAIRVSNLADWEYYQYAGTPYRLVTKLDMRIRFWTITPSDRTLNYSVSLEGERKFPSSGGPSNLRMGWNDESHESDVGSLAAWIGAYRKDYEDIFYSSVTSLKRESISWLEGQVIYDTTAGKYYRVGFSVSEGDTGSVDVLASSALTSSIVSKTVESGLVSEVSPALAGPTLRYKAWYESITLTFTEMNVGTSTITLPATANGLSDAPYSMFAIPCNGGVWAITANDLETGNPAPYMQMVASSIAESLGSKLYDIQLLPYCPMTEFLSEGGVINAYDMTSNNDYTYIKDSGNNRIGIVLFPKVSSFSVQIATSEITASGIDLSVSDNAVEAKVEGQCNTYRLCSPNYAAAFEFNLLKTGTVERFDIDCTYKPFSPYVKVSPVWGRLYGRDFNDTRGLILQGDFSLPIMNDQWKQYQINNKNYLNSFNREIESIELKNKYQRVSDTVNAISGTASAAAAGAAMGGVGAAVGGVASLGLGIADVAINERLRRDALDLTKDQFNYSLDNIRALPRTLAKVSSFDANNKLFPVLEYYTCTDQEKDIFRNKLTYNGMTVMRIDSIGNFVTSTPQYVKGKLIRIDIDGDDHTVNAIADELNMGVYI